MKIFARWPRRLHTLEAKFVLALTLICLVPFGLTGLRRAELDRETVAQYASQELNGLARGFAIGLDLYLTDLIRDTRMIAGTSRIASMDPGLQETALKEIFHEHAGFTRLSTFDMSGNRLASTQPGGTTSTAGQEVFEKVVARREPAWRINRAASTGRPSLLIGTPIWGPPQQMVGFLYALVDLESLAITVDLSGVADDGRVIVLDHDGRVLLHPDPGMIQEQQDLAWLGLSTDRPYVGPGALRYHLDGEMRLAGYARVPSVGWTVLADRSESTILEPTEQLWRLEVARLGIAALLATVIAVIVARALVRPLREAASAAHAFAAGDASVPLPHVPEDQSEAAALVRSFADMRTSVSSALSRVQESEARFRLLFAVHPHPLLVYDRDTLRILEVNDMAVEHYGYSRDEFLRMDITDLRLPEDVPAFLEQLHGERVAHEVHRGRKHRLKDGSIVEVEIHSHTLDFAGHRAALVMVLDVTERNRAEEGLAQLAAIVESSNDAIIGTDLDGTIFSWNAGAERLYGFSADQAIGQSISIVAPPEQSTDVLKLVAEANRGERLAPFERVRTRKDGQTMHVLITISAIRDAEGRVIATSAITHDITEVKRAEAALKESKSQLEETLAELRATQQQVIQQERLRALGQMASGIAHDFNNALSPVLGYSDLLLNQPEDLEDRDRVVRYLQLINMAAQDAAAVVSRLREFYRHRDEGEPAVDVNVNQVIAEAISLTQPKWKDQAMAEGCIIHLTTHLQGAPLIRGNPAELREMLTNLVFNAVDAMPAGGTLALSSRATPKHVVVEVADTGQGMAEDVRRRCLEPFFTTKGESGTGLGLSMIHGIVRRHAGSLKIDSAPGEGTTVTISLPIRRSRAAMPQPAQAPSIVVRPQRILLVDDEPPVRLVIAEYLRTDGHTVEVASNGREGLQKFHPGAFDLVITDRAMPDIPGDQLAVAIKQIAADTPIIMLTGFGGMMAADQEQPDGVDVVVGKPVTLAKLRDALAIALGGPGAIETALTLSR